jgi:hypothetical protein
LRVARIRGRVAHAVSACGCGPWGGTGQAPGSYARTVPLRPRLTVIEQVSRAVRTLTQERNRFRRLEAQALYAEGMTTAQLGSVLGVGRQRATVLLRDGS